jgi:AmpD protein
MQLDRATGWFHGIGIPLPLAELQCAPDGESISLLVIHNISLPPACFGTGKVQQFFQNRLTRRAPLFCQHQPPDRVGAPVRRA